MKAIRALFFRLAMEIEVSIQSQSQQADEYWAHFHALEAITQGRQGVSEFMEAFSLHI
jgi:hypothetical protein